MNRSCIRIFLMLLLTALCSCSDNLEWANDAVDEGIKGEMVQFTVGTTNNVVSTTRADGEGAQNYYMADKSRFVCRMYYCAKTGSDNIDVEGGTDFMAWLKVNGTVGNSLYWNKFYEPIGENEGFGGHDNLGNDYSADAFYWQNRKKHVFLALTDLNQATEETYKYGIDKEKLKLSPADITYTIKTSNKVNVWEPVGYEIYNVPEQTFADWNAVKTYVEGQSENKQQFNENQAACPIAQNNWQNANFEYMYGWSCKFSNTYATTEDIPVTESTPHRQKFGPIKYLMYYQTYTYDICTLPQGYIEVYNDNNKLIAYKDKYGIYLCNVVYKKNSEGHDTNEVDKYVKTDDYGNTLYDESNPLYTFYYYEIQEQHSVIDEHTYNMNAYDLTRKPQKDAQGNITSYAINDMSQQPDVCQAITQQAPLGATQAANRVNLYFKHQFSQVQVNIRNSADASVTINADQILKVELLGVTDEGYVCVDLNENGEINHPTAYKTVKASDYSTEHLEQNPYGTAFEMFNMAEPATGYLKSFNCITFGQLQAIRITWKEADTQIQHTATFRVTETNLQNLQSGVRYLWNMELRRGTLAVIRTEVENWIVPEDALDYGANGTIHN